MEADPSLGPPWRTPRTTSRYGREKMKARARGYPWQPWFQCEGPQWEFNLMRCRDRDDGLYQDVQTRIIAGLWGLEMDYASWPT